MIICEETTDVTSSQDFESSNFTILASSKAFQILSSNVYTRKVQAVVREISTNAHDAHVEAGVKTPFKVHLPTSIEPWFSVRDFGPGISNENMFNLYTQFFKSTRTSSNDFCGALGIGRMAPFTIVDSFLVTSFQNGEARAYCVFKDEHGTPKLSLLSTNKTNEPNGLCVHVQVEKGMTEEFKREATFVYSFFKDLPDINDPTIVENIKTKMVFDIENGSYKINYRSNGMYNELYAVMGNVAYSIDHSVYSAEIPFQIYGQVEFEMGSLSFNPGRESLALDKVTKENIKKKLKNLRKAVVEDSIKKIAETQNLFERYLVAINVNITEVKKSKEYKELEDYYDEYNKDNKKWAHEVFYLHSWRGSVTHKTTCRPQENCEYYIKNDKTKISQDRIRKYVGSTKKSVAVISQETADWLQVPANRIFPADNIPKVPRAPRTSNTVYNRIDLIKGEKTTHNVYAPAGEKIYVELGRFNTKGESYNSAYELMQLVAFLGSQNILDKNMEIYMVKPSMIKTKKFQNDSSWIKFDDFLKKKVDGKVVYTYNDVSNNTVDKILRLYETEKLEKLEFIKKYEETKQPNVIDRVSFIKKEPHPVCKKINEFEEKYPMIKFVDNYQLFRKEFRKTVIDYIKTIDSIQGE